MDKTNQIQLQTSSSAVQASTPEAIAAIRLDARTYPRYGNIAQRTRLEWLAKEIKALASVVRIKDFDGREAVFMASVLDEMLAANEALYGLALPEIHNSLMSGVFGKYGPFYGLSAPNLYGFLESYLESDIKQDSIRIIHAIYEEKRRAEREAEQRQIRAEIEEAKRNGSYVPGEIFGNARSISGDAIKSVGGIEREIAEKDAAHREKVRQQAMEILKNAGKL